MARVTAAFETAQAEVLRLKAEWEKAVKVHEANVLKLSKLKLDIEQRRLVLKKAEETAKKAQLRWKMLAAKRASKEAENIIHSAEQRERERWEAKKIQEMALAKARLEAEEAKKNAEAVNTEKFMVEKPT